MKLSRRWSSYAPLYSHKGCKGWGSRDATGPKSVHSKSLLTLLRTACFLSRSRFTWAVPLRLCSSHAPLSAPDFQTLTRCRGVHRWFIDQTHFVDTDFEGEGKEKKETWHPTKSLQKCYLFCWLNSCRMTCGSSCLIDIKISESMGINPCLHLYVTLDLLWGEGPSSEPFPTNLSTGNVRHKSNNNNFPFNIYVKSSTASNSSLLREENGKNSWQQSRPVITNRTLKLWLQNICQRTCETWGWQNYDNKQTRYNHSLNHKITRLWSEKCPRNHKGLSLAEWLLHPCLDCWSAHMLKKMTHLCSLLSDMTVLQCSSTNFPQ